MCRLFGFRSVIQSQVHSSLLHAENSLRTQSKRHPDGWGLAYFLEGTPHLVKSSDTAMNNNLFQKVSGVVSSQTVMAHIRKATQGSHSILNSHPFQYGHWIFAHNGNIKDFDSNRSRLTSLIDPELARFVLGTTDSEIFFFLILTEIKKMYPLSQRDIPMDQLKIAVEHAVLKVTNVAGSLTDREKPEKNENYLSFLLTNGQTFMGFQGGQPLNFCTHKTKCPERDNCPFFADSCEAAASLGQKVNHLIFSSETIEGVNVWNKLAPGEIVGIDHSMVFYRERIKAPFEAPDNA